MSEENNKILDMLREGKITAEEASKLLKYLGNEAHSSRSYLHNLSAHPLRPDISWVNDVRTATRESIWRTLFPIHAGLTLLGVTVGGLIGFFTGNGIVMSDALIRSGIHVIHAPLINSLIGVGVGGLIGSIIAVICNLVIIIRNGRTKQ